MTEAVDGSCTNHRAAGPGGGLSSAPRRLCRTRLARYLLAAVLVRLVDEGSRVALVLLALDQAGNAGTGGFLVAAFLIPHVVAAPAVGWLTDRASRPRLILAAAALGFAVCLGSSALLLGTAPLVVVAGVLVLGGCCGPALTGGLTSQLSRVVPPGRLPRAFGLDSMTYNVSGIAGPAMAGVFTVALTPVWGTVALAAVAGFGAVAIALLPLARIDSTTPAGERDADPAKPALTSGARAILTEPVLRTVTWASSLGQLGPGALAVAAAVLAEAQGQPAATGWLLSAVAAGGLCGSLWWIWRPADDHQAARTVMLAMLGVGAPLAIVAATTASLLATAALFAVSGIFLGPFTGALFLTRQHHAPETARAQVFTISAGLKTTAAATGAALGGAIAHIASPVQFLLISASPIIAGAVGLLVLRRQARLRQASP